MGTGERPQTYALDRAASGTGLSLVLLYTIYFCCVYIHRLWPTANPVPTEHRGNLFWVKPEVLRATLWNFKSAWLWLCGHTMLRNVRSCLQSTPLNVAEYLNAGPRFIQAWSAVTFLILTANTVLGLLNCVSHINLHHDRWHLQPSHPCPHGTCSCMTNCCVRTVWSNWKMASLGFQTRCAKYLGSNVLTHLQIFSSSDIDFMSTNRYYTNVNTLHTPRHQDSTKRDSKTTRTVP